MVLEKALFRVILLLLNKITQWITTMSDNPEGVGKDAEKTGTRQGENAPDHGCRYNHGYVDLTRRTELVLTIY